MAKIIVLTPLKNEEWILDQFLTITSLFADSIIIANQNSTDNSRNICLRFPKVYLVENTSEFNEDKRQILLIETARSLFPEEQRILICLDCDEILSSDSLGYKASWDKLISLKPGTSIFVEKPDLLFELKKCIRWRNNYFPIGYVDDGIPHTPTSIHSKRIPDNPIGEKIYVHDIKVLHFAHTRKNVQSAKQRYYSVLENIKNLTPVYQRRFVYKCFYEDSHYPQGNIEDVPPEWLKAWDDMKINIRKLSDVDYSWHDFEILYHFKKYGYRKFYMDDIWNFDWEGCRQIALKMGKDVPLSPVQRPGILFTSAAKILDKAYAWYRQKLHN